MRPLLAALLLAAAAVPARAVFPEGEREAAAMRYGFEGILRRLERAAGMPAEGVLFEYVHRGAGVEFSCARGPSEGTVPAAATICDGEGVLVMAGRPAYDLLSSGARGEDRVAFVMAHELAHIKHRHSQARDAKVDDLHRRWVDRRLAFLRERRREFPEQVERMQRGWSNDDQWWGWFFRDLLGRDLASERPTDAFLLADKEVARWLQDEFNLFVSRQESQADSEGCKIMACASYDPLESANSAFELGHLVWWETGEREDPRSHGSSAGRSRQLLHQAVAGECSCPTPPASEPPVRPRRPSR